MQDMQNLPYLEFSTKKSEIVNVFSGYGKSIEKKPDVNDLDIADSIIELYLDNSTITVGCIQDRIEFIRYVIRNTENCMEQLLYLVNKYGGIDNFDSIDEAQLNTNIPDYNMLYSENRKDKISLIYLPEKGLIQFNSLA